METEILDKLYLEWSQFTKARTQRELKLMSSMRKIAKAKSWEEQAVIAEYAVADAENREPEDWAVKAKTTLGV